MVNVPKDKATLLQEEMKLLRPLSPKGDRCLCYVPVEAVLGTGGLQTKSPMHWKHILWIRGGASCHYNPFS